MPYYRFDIDSPLTPEEAARRIADRVAPAPRAYFSLFRAKPPADAKPFLGKVGKDGFRIRRTIHHRNDFQPQVRGSIGEAREGSRTTVTMRPPFFTLAFMGVWIGGASLFLAYAIQVGKDRWHAAGFLLFGLAVMCGGFYYEAFKARRLLEGYLRDPRDP